MGKNNYNIDGISVDAKEYWNIKLAKIIQDSDNSQIGIHLNNVRAKKIFLLMKIFNTETPTKLFDSLLDQNFTTFGKKKEKVRKLMKLWECESINELIQNLIDHFVMLYNMEEESN